MTGKPFHSSTIPLKKNLFFKPLVLLKFGGRSGVSFFVKLKTCVSFLTKYELFWNVRISYCPLSTLNKNLTPLMDLILNNAPINVKPAMGEGGGGREAGHGVGIWHFSKICRQIPCPRANHPGQMQPNFPTPGCTLLSNTPRLDPRKAHLF